MIENSPLTFVFGPLFLLSFSSSVTFAKVDILLTSGTMATGLVSAIAGIFGMNLQSGGEPEVNDRSHQIFVLVAVIASVGAAFIFTALVAWMRHKKIMFVPEPNVDEMLKLSSSIKRSSFKFN